MTTEKINKIRGIIKELDLGQAPTPENLSKIGELESNLKDLEKEEQEIVNNYNKLAESYKRAVLNTPVKEEQETTIVEDEPDIFNVIKDIMKGEQ